MLSKLKCTLYRNKTTKKNFHYNIQSLISLWLCQPALGFLAQLVTLKVTLVTLKVSLMPEIL